MTKQDVITTSPEIGQWVDEVWSRNFGAASQAILKTKPFEFSPEEILKMDRDAHRAAAVAFVSDVLQREGLDLSTHEGQQRAQMVLSSYLNQAMQEAMGIKFYIWASQHDKRVRTAHAERDGKIFRWDTPPEGGHPSIAKKPCLLQRLRSVMGDPRTRQSPRARRMAEVGGIRRPGV